VTPVALLLCAVALAAPGAPSCAAPPESLIPPEALSRTAGLDDEIENLVVRGRLPVEARSFRPACRGELAYWLASRRPEGPAAATLRALLGWDAARWLTGEPGARPGGFALYDRPAQLLVAAPYARFMPRIEDGDWHWTEDSRVGVRMNYFAGRALFITSDIFAA
jgi:hypothetical protein